MKSYEIKKKNLENKKNMKSNPNKTLNKRK
jgi:hypothetical protein